MGSLRWGPQGACQYSCCRAWNVHLHRFHGRVPSPSFSSPSLLCIPSPPAWWKRGLYRADRRLDQPPWQPSSRLLRGRPGLASFCVRLPFSDPSSISNKPSPQPQHRALRAGSFYNCPLVPETVRWALSVAETGSWAGCEHLHFHAQGTTSSSLRFLTQTALVAVELRAPLLLTRNSAEPDRKPTHQVFS